MKRLLALTVLASLAMASPAGADELPLKLQIALEWFNNRPEVLREIVSEPPATAVPSGPTVPTIVGKHAFIGGRPLSWACGEITYSIDASANVRNSDPHGVVNEAIRQASLASGWSFRYVPTGGAVVISWVQPWPDRRVAWATSSIVDGSRASGVVKLSNHRAQFAPVVMHELGHVLGLAHVTSPVDLMDTASVARLTAYGPGDLEGFAALRAVCHAR